MVFRSSEEELVGSNGVDEASSKVVMVCHSIWEEQVCLKLG